jgi:multidrug efflux pump
MSKLNFKEFKPSSWAIDNKMAIYILTIIITLIGISAYFAIPKENFPEIVIPKIFISTVQAGTSPNNMENIVTKPLEKQLKSISGVKKMISNSYQDVSVITVEFNSDINVPQAKQKVKDAVDKARTDLPQTLTREPNIQEINLSDLPIMYVNISGNYDLTKMKKYADDLKDKIEGLKEITRVDLAGALDREIQINVDMYKLQAANMTLGDIQRSVAYENMNISAGNIPLDGKQRSLSIKNQFKKVSEIEKIIVGSQSGAQLYLKDFASVKDTFKEKESYARLGGKNVITLNIVKRSGENLIEASDKIKEVVNDMETNEFPKDLSVQVTGDQSNKTRTTLHDLINTIIIGFILVTVILMFFMGVTNALFVALSVPLSMFIAFMVMPGIDFTMNMIVLFGFLLALGIVVDDAIVVIENTHRIHKDEKLDIVTSAKKAAGEVFMPVLAGTLTTLAPFIPLAFWPGIIGKFMFYLPITMIISLLASLVVAYIINPVFAVDFMEDHEHEPSKKVKYSRIEKIMLVVFAAVILIGYLTHNYGLSNFLVFIILFMLLNKYVLNRVIYKFQTKTWPAFQNWYVGILKWCLHKPWAVIGITVLLFVTSIALFAIRKPPVIFFPQGEPNNTFVYVQLPVGTDPAKTNAVMKLVEKRVNKVIGDNNPLVESVITNVTVGVTDPQDEDQGSYPNRGKIALNFVQFDQRHGEKTSVILKALQEELVGKVEGAEVAVNKEQSGPPVSKPINIEVKGDDIEKLIKTSVDLKRYLQSKGVQGVVEYKSDFQSNKPEIVFDIDRERASREGISTGQIGMEIRNAVFGAEVSKFRDEKDEYPIQLRYQYDQRNNIENIRNLKITFRDMNMGGVLRSVPLSSFCEIKYDNTYGGIKRKNSKRMITLGSDVREGFNPNAVVAEVQVLAEAFPAPTGVTIKLTGQQEEQAETMAFLGGAMQTAIGLIILILVLLFNSVGKPFLILTEIGFSIIGVLLGVSIFKMEMSIVMTGIGIVALAGIVVRNGILLVEFAEFARAGGASIYTAALEAGRTRMTPVLLTATAAILGLIPLAVGLNLDFGKLFSELNPHIYFGGDNVVFWGPLSWTMIFGLSFATLLTLLLVPAMYIISETLKQKSLAILKQEGIPTGFMYVPGLIFILRILKGARGQKYDYSEVEVVK